MSDLVARVRDPLVCTDELHRALADALDRVREVHEPIDAAMYHGGGEPRIVKVCTGCGTDDGNWQRWPCPTIRALAPVAR